MKVGISINRQQGATIIVVMLVLLMITVVGVLSIQTAMTTSNIAANAQVGQLSSQTADTPINQIFIEDVIKQTNLSSIIGKALKDNETELGREYVFCYRPQSSVRFGSVMSMAVQRLQTDGTAELLEGSTDNYCDLSEDFGSARQGVVTQIAIKIPVDISKELPPLALLARATNVSGGQTIPEGIAEQKRVRVTTTAVMPSFAKDLTVAQACMKTYLNDDTDADIKGKMTVAQCLANLGVPVNSQMQEFNLQTFLKMVKEPT
ncbi:hypothetical protein [Acinetobacter sp. YH01021]|uniref:pilus assembly PilX family protein n=1 Tax=Acinetobacter sp. YH01021 TaxID=2601035 RepID=UPI0015D20DD3|nr:hypothetical protein [Acinetobacter sp. YH01021]